MSGLLPFAAVVLAGAAVVAHQHRRFTLDMPDDPVLGFRLTAALHEEADRLANHNPRKESE
ncbi:hypothetical protein ACIBCT_20835 [Streptosporangium sp. NPDC050855]|uniref:hypothetical protein n=1 Tax=Streptosporangium sp. NPDC050855 TaxID=3366194 RepID=UPI00379261F6